MGCEIVWVGAADGPLQGRALRLHLCTPAGELRLEAHLGVEGRARYRLDYASAEGWGARGARAVEVAVVPAASGVLVVPRRLEDRPLPPRAEPPPPVARPAAEEGLGAFLEGALAGDFAQNESWSALAGQTAIGFVPVAGQVADVRDLVAALDGLAADRPRAGVALGAALLGFVPGLDFLKGGTRLGRRALTEAADSADEVARAGLKRAVEKMSKEGAQRAKKELSVLVVGRAELMARLSDFAARGDASPRVLGEARALLEGLRDHFTPSDLTGALRDRLGVPVSKKDGTGTVFDHDEEVRSVLNSMENLQRVLTDAVVHQGKMGNPPGELGALLAAVKELRARTRAFLEVR